jgi:hypothetical protein
MCPFAVYLARCAGNAARAPPASLAFQWSSHACRQSVQYRLRPRSVIPKLAGIEEEPHHQLTCQGLNPAQSPFDKLGLNEPVLKRLHLAACMFFFQKVVKVT